MPTRKIKSASKKAQRRQHSPDMTENKETHTINDETQQKQHNTRANSKTSPTDRRSMPPFPPEIEHTNNTQYSEKDKTELPIAYFSQVLNKAERNYSTTERELLAILRAVQHYKTYVDGAHFKVVTDHASLKWLTKLDNPSGRLARWSTLLSQYDMEVIHRKGSLNVVADALSRIPCEVLTAAPAESDWYNHTYETTLNDPYTNPDYKIENTKLYRYFAPKKGEQLLNPWKVVLRPEDRKVAIKEIHDGKFAN